MKPAAGVVISLLMLPAAVRADVWPPPDEPCTRQKVEKADEYCADYTTSYQDVWGCTKDPTANPAPTDPQLCRQSTDAARQACCTGWLAAGWSYRCKTKYNGPWYHVLWCRARQPGDPAPVKEDGGCTIGRGAAGGAAGLALIAVVLVLSLLRQRRR